MYCVLYLNEAIYLLILRMYPIMGMFDEFDKFFVLCQA